MQAAATLLGRSTGAGGEYIALNTREGVDEYEDDGVGAAKEILPRRRTSPVGRRSGWGRLSPTSPRVRVSVVLVTAASFALLFVILVGWRYNNGSDTLTVVLEPSDNPYFSKGDRMLHNAEVIARLERCAALGILRNTSDPHLPRPSDEEEQELIAQGCGTNETTILILASFWLGEAYQGTQNTGETVYAQSVISTLNANNYGYLFATLGWLNHDMRRASEYWRAYRNNVRLVIADPEQIDICWSLEHAPGQKCLKRENNLDGIEAWRLLGLWWWDDPGNPLGPLFTLSPSPRNSNYFLSYSIEPTCKRLPYLHPSQRLHPPQAYILAKQVHYLGNEPQFSWTLDKLSQLQHALKIHIVGGMTDDNNAVLNAVADAGIMNFGKLGKMEFYEAVAQSFVLLGVGRPRISPSPWDALCMGVPFINPVLTWDEADPANRTSWHPQQWHMTDIQEPYVYHVLAHDLDGLERAVRLALNTPIDSYIPDYMAFDHVTRLMAEVVDGDWRARAAAILDERIRSGEGELFLL